MSMFDWLFGAKPDLLWGFKKGERVRHKVRGWVGTVQGEPSDTGIVWCVFDDVGQAGAFHANLERKP